MTPQPYPEIVARFEQLVRSRRTDRTMTALIIDSPWLPGFAGENTLDFFFDDATWLDAYSGALGALPGVAFVPGSWVEFGMAAEPTGWGAPVRWTGHEPPSLRRFPGGIEALLECAPPDPETDGLMPAALRRYERLAPELTRRGLAPRMAAARGPLAVASHLMGVTEFLMATKLDRDNCLALLDRTTDLCIAWLSAQLARMDDPIAILVLDDVVGLINPNDADDLALGRLRRIFDAFPGLIHIFHNDTPNEKVYAGLATIGMDLFNFSHEITVERARELLGAEIVLMGNVPPLDVLVRGTVDEVRASTEKLIESARRFGPLLVSPGGGVSPGTPIENLQALAEVAETF